jgi:hypothetical protein
MHERGGKRGQLVEGSEGKRKRGSVCVGMARGSEGIVGKWSSCAGDFGVAVEEEDAGGTRCQWEREDWAAAGLDPSGWAGSGAGFRPSWVGFPFFFVLFIFLFLFSILNPFKCI